MELPSVPRRDRVLLGLRHLRRAADRAATAGSWAPPASSASARDEGDGTTTHHYYRKTSTISPGRRARTTSSGASDSSTRGLPAVAMRLLLQPEHVRAGRTPLRRDARGAALLRRVVRSVSVREHHRSSIPRGRARRAAWSIRRSSPPARAGWRRGRSPHPEGRDDPRSRPSVLVRHRRDQRVRARVDGRRLQHVLDGARHRRQSFDPNTTRSGTSADFVPWVFRDVPLLSRATDGNRLSGFRAAATHDAQSTPTWRYWPGTAGAHHLQQDRALAQHARADARLGDAPEGPVDLLRALRVQASRAQRTSSRSRTKSADGI